MIVLIIGVTPECESQILPPWRGTQRRRLTAVGVPQWEYGDPREGVGRELWNPSPSAESFPEFGEAVTMETQAQQNEIRQRKFPKSYRFSVAAKLENGILDFVEATCATKDMF